MEKLFGNYTKSTQGLLLNPCSGFAASGAPVSVLKLDLLYPKHVFQPWQSFFYYYYYRRLVLKKKLRQKNSGNKDQCLIFLFFFNKMQGRECSGLDIRYYSGIY